MPSKTYKQGKTCQKKAKITIVMVDFSSLKESIFLGEVIAVKMAANTALTRKNEKEKIEKKNLKKCFL